MLVDIDEYNNHIRCHFDPPETLVFQAPAAPPKLDPASVRILQRLRNAQPGAAQEGAGRGRCGTQDSSCGWQRRGQGARGEPQQGGPLPPAEHEEDARASRHGGAPTGLP
eukprot:6706229-Lingulodinium_polyedra.AAC.1